jgi:homoprotocatechuate degradation regulator HpaR
MLLLRARESTMEHFRPILNENGVTEQQWRTIRALYELGESNAQDLAQASSILSPSLSRIISRLVADGIVKRTVSPEDQRESILTLTAKGKKLHDKIGTPVEERYKEIQQRLCPEKLAQLYDLLNELADLNRSQSR